MKTAQVTPSTIVLWSSLLLAWFMPCAFRLVFPARRQVSAALAALRRQARALRMAGLLPGFSRREAAPRPANGRLLGTRPRLTGSERQLPLYGPGLDPWEMRHIRPERVKGCPWDQVDPDWWDELYDAGDTGSWPSLNDRFELELEAAL